MNEPAPLFAGEEAAAAPPGAAEWVLAGDGARLRAALFAGADSTRGSVVVSPGRTEPIEKYLEVAERLAERGFTTLVHDWRGQGLSQRALADRTLGHANGWAAFLSDYRIVLDAFAARLPAPWIALGHSMGGCLALLALAEGEARFAGSILSAPMLALRTKPITPWAARLIAFVLARTGRAGAPIARASAEARFETNILTHDPVRWRRNEDLFHNHPDLALGAPTWGWLDFAFAATDRLARGSGTPRIAIPVTICVADEERLVENAGARAIAARLPRGRLVEVPGAFHEILQETDAKQAPFWRAFDRLADEAAPARGASASRVRAASGDSVG